MQTKLESLRVDTITTLDTVANIFDGSKSPEITQKMNRQMDILEKRLSAHKLTLQTLSQHEEETIPMEKSQSISSSSRHSFMSSIFGDRSSSISSCATSIEENNKQPYLQDDDQISYIESITSPYFEKHQEEEDHPFFDLAGKRSFGAGSFCGSVYQDNFDTTPHQEPTLLLSPPRSNRRRQRRQRHQQQLQQLYPIETDSLTEHSSSEVEQYHHPLSPPTYHGALNRYFLDSSMHEWYHNNNDQLMYLHQEEEQETKWTKDCFNQRNILDEAMSFLDGLGEDGDDGGFGEDMYLLLQNPDLCCKPLSEIEMTMKELRQQQSRGLMLKKVIHLLKPTTWIQLAFKYSRMMLYTMACTGLDWCRFLSILAAAVMISLLKGPEDIKRNKAF